MELITDNYVFGLIVTVAAFFLANAIRKRLGYNLANPLLIAIVLITGFLVLFDIPYQNYKKGADLIHYFLGPATVILAVPLYKQLDKLKKNMLPILGGVFAGSGSALFMLAASSKLFGFNASVAASLLPKSVTMPIGLQVSETLGGISALTVISIVVTGITGAVFAEKFLKWFSVSDPAAQGVAIGTSAHALGTTKAVEMGEVQGGMSGLAIGLAGMITAVLAPFVFWLFY